MDKAPKKTALKKVSIDVGRDTKKKFGNVFTELLIESLAAFVGTEANNERFFVRKVFPL